MSDFATKLRQTMKGLGEQFEELDRGVHRIVAEASTAVQDVTEGRIRLELRPKPGISILDSIRGGKGEPERDMPGAAYNFVMARRNASEPSDEAYLIGQLFVSVGENPIRLYSQHEHVRDFTTLMEFQTWLHNMADNPDSDLVRRIAFWEFSASAATNP